MPTRVTLSSSVWAHTGPLLRLRVLDHGSEFVYLVRSSMGADAFLGKEHRPLGIQLDQHGNQQEQRPEKDQQNQGKCQVDASFEFPLEPGFFEAIRKDQPAGVDFLDDELSGEHFIKAVAFDHLDAIDATLQQLLDRKVIAPLLDGHHHLIDIQCLCGLAKVIVAIGADIQRCVGRGWVAVRLAIDGRRNLIPAVFVFGNRSENIFGQITGSKQNDLLIEQAAAQHVRVSDPPKHNEGDKKNDADQENVSANDTNRKKKVDQRQNDRRRAQRLDQADKQFLEGIGHFQVIQIIVVQAHLRYGGNQQGFQYQAVARRNKMVADEDPAGNDHREKYEQSLTNDKNGVAHGIVLFE